MGIGAASLGDGESSLICFLAKLVSLNRFPKKQPVCV